MKIAKIFTKKSRKINTIITDILPGNKSSSFPQTTINETNKILEAECSNLPQIYFMTQYGD